jgi:hypothetical protein
MSGALQAYAAVRHPYKRAADEVELALYARRVNRLRSLPTESVLQDPQQPRDEHAEQSGNQHTEHCWPHCGSEPSARDVAGHEESSNGQLPVEGSTSSVVQSRQDLHSAQPADRIAHQEL